MVRRRALARREVRWFDREDEAKREQVSVYIVPRHHADRGKAAERNEGLDVSEYNLACQQGRAVIVDTTEVDDG